MELFHPTEDMSRAIMDSDSYGETLSRQRHGEAISEDGHELTLRELYPTWDDATLQQAEDTLRRYLDLARQIYERITADPEAYALFKTLTASRGTYNMRNNGSISGHT